MKTIVVTIHALQRWRERFAIYGDETIEDIRKAFAVAVAEQGEPPQGYCNYQIGGMFFAIETNKDYVEIITVIEKETTPEIKQEEECEYVPKGRKVKFVVPDFPNAVEKRKWLIEEHKKCQLLPKKTRRALQPLIDAELSAIKQNYGQEISEAQFHESWQRWYEKRNFVDTPPSSC